MERIWHFNAERTVDIADKIEEAIREGVQRLEAFPNSGRPHDHGTRLMLLRHIQYVVAYRVEEDRVTIAAVHSTRENR